MFWLVKVLAAPTMLARPVTLPGVAVIHTAFNLLCTCLLYTSQRSACEQVCVENRTMFFQIAAAHTPILANLVFRFLWQRKVWNEVDVYKRQPLRWAACPGKGESPLPASALHHRAKAETACLQSRSHPRAPRR